MNLDTPSSSIAPLDLSKWRHAPILLMVVGGIGAGIGARACGTRQFAFSWLLAFMFYLSLCLGGWFLVMVHHLFDASWSVPTRRFCEHLGALLFPWLAVLFVPVLLLAPKIFTWMTLNPNSDRALSAKWPMFTWPGFCVTSAILFGIWWLLSSRLRYPMFRRL